MENTTSEVLYFQATVCVETAFKTGTLQSWYVNSLHKHLCHPSSIHKNSSKSWCFSPTDTYRWSWASELSWYLQGTWDGVRVQITGRWGGSGAGVGVCFNTCEKRPWSLTSNATHCQHSYFARSTTVVLGYPSKAHASGLLPRTIGSFNSLPRQLWHVLILYRCKSLHTKINKNRWSVSGA